MRLPRLRFTIRVLLIAITVAAIPMGLFRGWAGVRVKVGSNEQAVEAAAALVMTEDARFRPDKHMARVYLECGGTPLLVDFSPDDATHVVKRVGITAQGGFRGPSTFSKADGVKSFRDGPGLYLLDRKGKVTGLVPWWAEGGRPT
jgi:hypothetical protein